MADKTYSVPKVLIDVGTTLEKHGFLLNMVESQKEQESVYTKDDSDFSVMVVLKNKQK